MLKEILCAIRGHRQGVIHEHITITFPNGSPMHAIICTCGRCNNVVVLKDRQAEIMFVPVQEEKESTERAYMQ